MSGFEVVGVVLGAFPLAISAFEGYRKLATKRKLFLEFGAEYQRSIIKLNFNKVRFIGSLKQLLLPLAIPDDEIHFLLHDPGIDLWRNPRIAVVLQARLQDSCSLYLNTVHSIHLTMEEVNRELAIHKAFYAVMDQNETKDGAPGSIPTKSKNPLSKANREYQMYKLKFSNGKRNRERLFEQLGKFNDQLEMLLSISDVDSDLQKARNVAMKSATASVTQSAICKFWHFASQFYQTLLMAWNCNCLEQHYAHFLLQHRTSATKDIKVVLMPLLSSERGQWPSRQLNIEVRDKSSTRIPDTSNANFISPAMHIHDNDRSDGSRVLDDVKGKGKSTLVVPITVAHQSLCADISGGEKKPIASLCKTMAEEADSICASYLQDNERRYYLYPSDDSCNNYSPSPVTLSDLLSGKVGQMPTRRQRYSLALILASSFLQLHGSPWMVVPWGKSSIYFPREPESLNSILLDHVSLARGFSSSPINGDTQESPALEPPVEIQGLDSLAILLLELCFGRPIEDHRSRKGITLGDGQARAALDFVVAWTWHREVNDEAGDDYADAVKWCLTCCKSAPVGNWRKEMIENVIAPLERCCKYFRNALV
ncbi:hypothetical protein PFICI_08305 [Pestalotiopsis fici W106-1]|uniref:DUF7580 domain-containing protein n=1 Tax=Pestalotiopsis fici (strain W106-1 / CGMCC3.15140) TaxID=1229662 RepID=W3X6I3_PESFW|nr:uncharacterized protein PFICI_08305 [Pestalotiopsis fici W106-1]ETS80776.1 hypothetical protein PFICI_08305 [Pestalotiopsis fici W106-1]